MSSSITETQKVEGLAINSECEPERNLAAAIIMQAVSDIRGGNKSNGQSADERSARRWMRENRPEIRNSFVCLCSLLDLNPDRIRAVVLN